jgi:hypothetical protein
VRGQGHHPREDGAQGVVDGCKDLARTQHARRPGLGHKDPAGRQLFGDHALIELARVQLETGPARHGVGQVADDDVEGPVGRGPQLGGRVIHDQGEAGVLEGGRVGGQVALTELADDRVDVDHGDGLNGRVAEDLPRGRPLPTARNEDAARGRVG